MKLNRIDCNVGGVGIYISNAVDYKVRTDLIVGFFYFCQYLHIGAGILSFGADVFRL